MTTHTIEKISACKERITVIIDPKTVKKAIQHKIKDKAGKLNHGGFRANSSITQSRVQITPEEKAAIHQELCKKSFSQLASKEELSYQGTPRVDSINEQEDGSLRYTVDCEKYPEISHVNWEGVTLEKLDTEITDSALQDAEPFFTKMGFAAPMESKESATQWASWMIEIFQRQKTRDQVIEALLKQNTVDELPERLIEERYQELLQEYKDDESLNEDTLREKARQYITTDILFKAYGLEHKITVERETFLAKIQEAAKNPFIMSHIKDQSLLPYYLAPRIVEDSIIDHLVANATSNTEMIPLKDFMALAFNQKPEESNSKEETEVLEEPKVATEDLSTSEDLTKPEETQE